MAAISQRIVFDFLLSAIGASTMHEKGRTFEDLVCYILSRVPGITIEARNVLNPYQSEEVDVVFWNDKDRRGFYFLPTLILVEAKSWSAPVDSAAVSDFILKLRERNLTFGLLVALNGITGSQQHITGARDRIRSALRDGIEVIVITGADLANFASGAALIEFVKIKKCQIAASGTQVD